ncbi:FBP domain-containing protein [Mycolicibacterium sp. J2]|uniref:FBP domain-containing protein n=1 Tax=Mycolicibacterium sp. J2 TaxID=2993511 RepID=UPI00224B2247|nr:FBP domain-containing protein [Mycolicibacterium sp. J2]MCX2713642.1 FBP domain-containing protein [Mycolicibacterium sp. J2]
MHSYTRSQILDAFRGATRSEVKKVTFAADFDAVEFDKLEYYGWTDPKIPRRAYLVVERPEGPIALLLSRAAAKPRGRAMCTWCNDVNLTDEAVLYTVRRGGAAGRKGDTIGMLICANFGCSRHVRQLPPAYHKGTDLDRLREQRIDELRRKVRGFVDKVLSTEG